MKGGDGRDPWLEGFNEGRRAMAKTVAARLAGTMPENEIAALLGFAASELFGENSGGESGGETPAPAKSRYDHAAVPGLTLVEPAFVRAVRTCRRLTQPQLAAILGVNARTVCEWETSSVPVRMKSASYARLADLAAAGAGNAPGQST